MVFLHRAGEFLRPVLLLFLFLPLARASEAPPSTVVEGLEYDGEYFPGAAYDPGVATPDSILGFPVGQRTATPEQIERCLRAWEDSPRTRLVEYARSHEDRPLYYVVVSSPVNLNRIDEIQAGYRRLADPRGLSTPEGRQLVESLPGVAWFAYSIHGNESSGADAALAVLYHLVAATGEEVGALLDDLVVLIDPMMNPDGRARFVKQLAEHRAANPNLDDQSLLHAGYWPWGRTNHYLFDLNRDWILGVHPETRGRIRAAQEWNPLLFIDAHEMGPQNTYLFSPPRDPVNPNFPDRHIDWLERFARDHAAAFDRFPWPYYTGEWNDGWYPGYSNAWAGFRGAVGILYEQARVAEDGVRRPGDTLLTYRESVHHQVVSTMSNLRTLHRNRAEILRDYLADRRLSVDPDGPYADRTFAVLPTRNRSRLNRFLDLMELQGFEVYAAPREFSVSNATDQFGRTIRRRRLPEGTILIPNRQPEARLVATMLEFDPRIPERSLRKERHEILRKGRSRNYDVTAWNLTMMYGLPALTLSSDLPEGAVRLEGARSREPQADPPTPEAIAFVIDGVDDLSVVAAGRLMERGVEVRVADQAFLFDLEAYGRGSVVITRADNPGASEALRTVVEETVGELGGEVHQVVRGYGEGDFADIGGEHFTRMEAPRIALVSRGEIHPYDFGSIWHQLDQRLGLRHSHLNETYLAGDDLRRYNVLVLPDRFDRPGEEAIDPKTLANIRGWVEAGGTLISIGHSAAALTAADPGLTRVRTLPETFEDLDPYRIALSREILAAAGDLPGEADTWSYLAPDGPRFPWSTEAPDLAGKGKEDRMRILRKRDEWQMLFMPQGAILAGRVDREHWLTFGTEASIPVLFRNYPVLMAAPPVEAPVRFGILVPPGEAAAGDDVATVGWAQLPPGYRLRLRMSGLLWPEAAHRIANSAWVTREQVGNGQVILFAAPPVFRGATLGTARILSNAMVLGPGFGATAPIRP